jgi:2-polyprenyl-3-methyl-5-hydroxy-6-metoxy-1,4-benzoquinol methylase
MYQNNDIDYLKWFKKNNKQIIIWGAGARGKFAFGKLKGLNISVKAFIDQNSQKQAELLFGIKVIAPQDIEEYNDESTMIIICNASEGPAIKEQLLNKNIFNFLGYEQIDFGGGAEHYDEAYFDWQKSMGEFGAKFSARLFEKHISPDMTVLEFGSGGGYLLDEIKCQKKVGIEINQTARAEALKRGIEMVADIDDIPADFADIIISTSVLEHVENPFGALKALHGKLKEKGKIVFYVPNEGCEAEYSKSDINNHLYTWNCLNIGNLFKAAGFFVRSVERVQEMWPKDYMKLREELSEEMFWELCFVRGRAYDENRCLIVAYK